MRDNTSGKTEMGKDGDKTCLKDGYEEEKVDTTTNTDWLLSLRA